MKEEFYAFLKKHKCYREWLKYTERNKIMDIFENEKPEDYLWMAFTWAEANDLSEYNQKDHNYWGNIKDLWAEHLETLQS